MTPADLRLQRLQGLPEPTMRARVIREALVREELDEVVELLGAIIERGLFGVAPGEDALLALVPNLVEMQAARTRILQQRRALAALDPSSSSSPAGAARRALDPDGQLALWERLHAIYDHAVALRDASMLEDEHAIATLRLRAVARLLVDPPPHRKAPPRADRLGPRRGRHITLGERKAMAAGGDRVALEMLLYDRDPSVVARLCRNPRVVEQDVLFVATRRPNDPAILREIALSSWLTRYAVRHALVLNPYIETGLALRLLPLLHEQDLTAVCFSGDVHPMLREAATELMSWRRAAAAQQPAGADQT